MGSFLSIFILEGWGVGAVITRMPEAYRTVEAGLVCSEHYNILMVTLVSSVSEWVSQWVSLWWVRERVHVRDARHYNLFFSQSTISSTRTAVDWAGVKTFLEISDCKPGIYKIYIGKEHIILGKHWMYFSRNHSFTFILYFYTLM